VGEQVGTRRVIELADGCAGKPKSFNARSIASRVDLIGLTRRSSGAGIRSAAISCPNASLKRRRSGSAAQGGHSRRTSSGMPGWSIVHPCNLTSSACS